jgi:hypothetical protein
MIINPTIISRLKNQLNATGLLQKDPQLYQVINQLIGLIQNNSESINSGSNIGPSGPSGKDGIPGFILSNDSDGNNDILIPGPRGIDGSNGSIGRDGVTIIDTEVIEDFIFTVPGPQGNPGPTGASGPIGPMFPIDEYFPDDLLIPGPAGANGSNGSGSDILSATINLTDAQFRALGTTPVTVVAAPGAGFVLVPLSWHLIANITAGFSGSPVVQLQYTGGGVSGLGGNTCTATTIHKRLVTSGWLAAQNTTVETTKENTALEVFSSLTVTGGTTNAGFNFTLFYTKTAIP